jgi:sulfate adenylyltransferase subunit 1
MSAVEQINANVNKERGLLRFITAGSVDDGKSTLIGRLLFDSKGILQISSMQFPAPNISAPWETR